MFAFWRRDRTLDGERSATPKRYRTTYEQNLARTEKARFKINMNRLKVKLDTSATSQGHEDASVSTLLENGRSQGQTYLGRLQRSFLGKAFAHAQYQEDTYSDNWFTFTRDRARCVVALIGGIVSVLNSMFSKEEIAFHLLNCHTVDDTNTRMRGPNPGADPTTIYTVMNSVQSVHVQYTESKHCFSSFQIPTPLVIVENPDTGGIDTACMSTAFVTSSGVGQLLSRFGVKTPKARFRTYIFIGDSLRANNSAFRRESARLAKQRQEASEAGQDCLPHMSLQLHCMVHAVCLIRKPAVLAIRRFWTTLVRLAHLFESVQFRKSVASCMSSILSANFVCIQSPNLPESMDHWRKRAVKLQESFWCASPRKRDMLVKILEFFNGDLGQPSIVHHCTFDNTGRPCCEDSATALSKALRLCVPWFASGYPVPLLYRFKHYSHAAGFVHVGVGLHKLLIRALALVDSESAHSLMSLSSGLVDKLLGETEGDNDQLISQLQELQLDVDESFAHTNLKRKQMVKAEVGKAAFCESTLIVNTIILPMDSMLNRLFKRSERLSRMTTLGDLDASNLESETKSKEVFLRAMSGEIGWGIIETYCNLLQEDVHSAIVSDLLTASAKNLQTIWVMSLSCMTDTWRRFVHDHLGFPYILFGLLSVHDIPEFCALWDKFQAQSAKCPHCVDPGYSKVLLDAFPQGMSDKPPAEQKLVFDQVTSLLSSVAQYAPLSSDPVECKNGRIQWLVSRRGNQAVKAPHAARESSFLQSSILPHEMLKHFVDAETLPPKRTMAGIIRCVGSSKNSSGSVSLEGD